MRRGSTDDLRSRAWSHAQLAPADRRLYALRDVTATVECIPLIVASILSKKLAEGIEGLVLDVKCGGGAFMKDLKSARALAKALVSVGQGAGKRVSALITDMSAPIGRSVGNALETREAIEILQNRGPSDTRALTLELGAEMLVLGKRCKTRKQAWSLLEAALADGSALAVFRRLVKAQGGDVRVVDDPSRLPQSKLRRIVKAPKAGYVTATACADTLARQGTMSFRQAHHMMGRLVNEAITRGGVPLAEVAGTAFTEVTSESVASRANERGAALLTIHAARRELAQSVEMRASVAFRLGARAPKRRPLVLERVD